MKEAFLKATLNDRRLAQAEICNRIIEDYLAQGLRLTLRQLYYQLVTMNEIPNQERAYKNLGKLVSDARLQGLVDWDAIEDRVRIPRTPQEFENLGELVDVAKRAYRLPRWRGQPEYIELWVEKDALSGVLAPLATEYHVTLMVNRGYSSQSAMYGSAKRFDAQDAQLCTVLYLGDHDPSGEDMVRDVADRLQILARASAIEVEKIALTWEQVQHYDPPPNPTKLTDSRAEGYIAQYGDECWEVDALRPDVLAAIVRDAIEGHLDKPLMDKVKARERADKAQLERFVRGLR